MFIPEVLIDKAIRTSAYTDVRRAKVSAIAFKPSGHIIATAHNRRIEGKKGVWTQHAEEAVIAKLLKLKAFQRFKHINILVIRVNQSGIVAAKPCKRCQRLIDKFNLTIYYSEQNKIKKLARKP